MQTGQGTLEQETLVELYGEQWRELRHTDWLVMGLFGLTLVLSIGLFAIHEAWGHAFSTLEVALFFGAGIALPLASSHITLRLASRRIMLLTIVQGIERALGITRAGVMPLSVGSALPRNATEFIRRLIYSSRGPIVITYFLLGWGSTSLGISYT